MKKDAKILVIIPAFNEGKSIRSIIADIRKHLPAADVVVVNDGSSDNTMAAARAGGAEVIDMPYNVGIGAAMQTGYKYAQAKGYDVAVQCDGDGQHPPYQIKNLVAPILDGAADIVVGSRFLGNFGYRSSIPRQIGIILFSRMLSFITRTRLTDTTCGFRALNKRTVASFARYYPCDYPEVEALVLAHQEGLRIKEIPIRILRRQHGVSSISALDSFYYTIKVFLAVMVDLFKAAPAIVEGETE